MAIEFAFTLKSFPFDEDYRPSDSTRITTNFANLARGETRRENLRNAFSMIDNRFNVLTEWDNPRADRYSVALEIISVEIRLDAPRGNDAFPLMEMLNTTIIDRKSDERLSGVVGNNFSSYVRDYDFSIHLPRHNENRQTFDVPADFGDLHGALFKGFVNSAVYAERFSKAPVICLSVSSSRSYSRTDNRHPVLGVEYRQDEPSLTDRYFAKMGLQVRFFMLPGSVAPLAFYCAGDLLRDYSNLELIGTISTMETFQKIYRPEIYNANAAAGKHFRPSLAHRDHSLTHIVYDREERSRLAIEQGRFAEEHFVKPCKAVLDRWCAGFAL